MRNPKTDSLWPRACIKQEQFIAQTGDECSAGETQIKISAAFINHGGSLCG